MNGMENGIEKKNYQMKLVKIVDEVIDKSYYFYSQFQQNLIF